MPRRILVTGDSIAGNALAWWLHHHGADVTVLERAPAFRDGGQNIDVRGAGRTVLRRMGLEEAVREAGTGERGIDFVDEGNRLVARFDSIPGEDGPTAELEILRGDLAHLLHDRAPVTRRYGTRVAGIENRDDAAEVAFEDGGTERFDLVLVAEGIGSSTRRLLFADEVRRRSLDLTMGYFTIPRGPGDGDRARWFNAPGGRSVFLRPDNRGTTRAVLTLQRSPDGSENLSPAEQKAMLRRRFADAGWETPRVLDGLDASDDFYFEAIGQVRMDRWSSGRVALTGDAAWCASPISGMGTTLAVVGAYVLAGELSRHERHEDAFAAYDRIMRPYVDQAQAVPSIGPRIAQPRTRLGVALQRGLLRVAARPALRRLAGRLFSPPAERIALPDYAPGA